MVLNEEQSSVLVQLRDYASGVTFYDFSVFSGFAGVGKSTVLGKMVESLPSSIRVGMTAPTHKAVNILRKSTLNPRLYQFGTIHSFFGLKQNIRNGKIVYENEYGFTNKLKVDGLDVLIIDEGSMLDSRLLKAILDYKAKRPRLKLIITGDPAQLPPVGEKESLGFSKKADEKYKVLRVSLSKIMRQIEGNPILEFATDVRNNLTQKIEIPLNITVKEEKDLETLIDTYFTESYSNNPDFCKVLAYTNKAVNDTNRIIRNKLFNYPAEAIIVGDELITDKPIPISQELTIQTSEELVVEKVDIDETRVTLSVYNFDGSSTDSEETFQVYVAVVKHIHPVTETEMRSVIQILHPSSQILFDKWQQKLKNNALMVKSKKAWVEFYSLENCFAQVKYNYCLTVHKSQGSSFENIILLDSNVYEAGSYDPTSKFFISLQDRNKLRYVGITRAKNNLILI
jgi:ATP-dependent exoDNAse (exonuclease V) alpha subunit